VKIVSVHSEIPAPITELSTKAPYSCHIKAIVNIFNITIVLIHKSLSCLKYKPLMIANALGCDTIPTSSHKVALSGQLWIWETEHVA
jgi:hypothetical protein